MNFWTFLDRNAAGLFFLVVIALMYGFGSCGSGCHVRLGPVTIETSDGGAP